MLEGGRICTKFPNPLSRKYTEGPRLETTMCCIILQLWYTVHTVHYQLQDGELQFRSHVMPNELAFSPLNPVKLGYGLTLKAC